MWKTLQDTFPRDKDFPERVARIQAYQRVLDGSMYAQLEYAAHEEYDSSKQYIPLRDRRPSIRHNLCRLAVEQSVAMLFSDGHWPTIEHDDEVTRETLRELVNDVQLNLTMIEAAMAGSVGSTAIWLRILEGRVYVDVLDTAYLTPIWNPKQPDQLEKVVEKRKLTGADLAEMGYAIKDDDLKAAFWWSREWNNTEELWLTPVKVVQDGPKRQPVRDDGRTIVHGLNFVPMVWVKNLPGGDQIDGRPSFCDEAIETQITIEYQMTQGDRALRYAGDPTLLIKEPAGSEGDLVRSASNAIVVDKDGDAKMLEIDGTATSAVLEYVRAASDLAKEQLHASRVNPDRITVAQSARAMEILNQPLIWLTDKLRISYGQGALLSLLKMIVKVGSSSQLVSREGEAYPKFKTGKISLKWPAWYAPTAQDLSTTAGTLKTNTDAGLMSKESAVTITAGLYDIEDVDAELKKIAEDQAKLAEQSPQIKENINA